MSAARFVQVKRLADVAAVRAHLASLDVELPIDDDVEAGGALAQPLTITDAGAGQKTAPNRWSILPMEGWDGTDAGAPTDLVRRRWDRFAASGVGLVWGEATAVQPDGRANPHQLVLDETTAPAFAELRGRLGSDQVSVLQLTHSGRYARPSAAGPAPRTLYRHPLLDTRVGADDTHLFTDAELDALVDRFVSSAVLAADAGFDFVDVKACHGYLGHEFLSAYDRPGPYGGDLDGRLHFFTSVVAGIRAAAPTLGIALRLSAYDLVPHRPGADGVGEPEITTSYSHAFGGDGHGGVDLTETHALLDRVADLGIGLVSVTAGSPYYVPHVQRPAYFPPSDGYKPPEDPLVGVARMVAATREITERHPRLVVVASGLSYLQDYLPHVGQAMVNRGQAHSIGLGRMALSYPHMAADQLAGRPFDRRLVCRTFSDCTTAPRHGMISGCYPLDDFYNDREERVTLAGIKKQARAALRGGE